jgi:hypothetical protein
MERQKMLKVKKQAIIKYKYAYNKVLDKLSSKGRFLRNKIEQNEMELKAMLYS